MVDIYGEFEVSDKVTYLSLVDCEMRWFRLGLVLFFGLFGAGSGFAGFDAGGGEIGRRECLHCAFGDVFGDVEFQGFGKVRSREMEWGGSAADAGFCFAGRFFWVLVGSLRAD